MAVKNHALDEKILQAAQTEFLEKGYEAASMRKIAAQAGVTVGAIYTRYPTKDALFASLVQPLLDRIAAAYEQIRSFYYDGPPDPRHMAKAMEVESQSILHLLFDDYDRAHLLLCRSTGSSLEHFFDQLVEEKIRETIHFFQVLSLPHPEEPVLRLLVSGQFHMYVQIIQSGCDLTAAKNLMQAAMIYHTGGWMALLQQENSDWEVHSDEV